jgi:RNA polymerase sigma factor (sigma-70 family)
MANYTTDESDHFRKFASSLEKEIAKYQGGEETLYAKQKRQVDGLCAAELKFRDILTTTKLGTDIYNRFVSMIHDEKRNILAARPYFRERQDIFTSGISKALKAKDVPALQKFHFNFGFVQFALRVGGSADPKLVAIAKTIAQLRTEIVEVNMPLAISRARIFWSRTPRAHLEYMDFVQIASEGLMAAVDKFVAPYTPVFRSVAIGRMHGNFIDQYSETPIHFYPVDRRKIYRANKAIGKLGGIADADFNVLAAIVNEGAEENQRTTPMEIADLLAAASVVPSDAFLVEGVDGDEVATAPSGPSADVSAQPDTQYERAEVHGVLQKAIQSLSPFERKLLRMKGV